MVLEVEFTIICVSYEVKSTDNLVSGTNTATKSWVCVIDACVNAKFDIIRTSKESEISFGSSHSNFDPLSEDPLSMKFINSLIKKRELRIDCRIMRGFIHRQDMS